MHSRPFTVLLVCLVLVLITCTDRIDGHVMMCGSSNIQWFVPDKQLICCGGKLYYKVSQEGTTYACCHRAASTSELYDEHYQLCCGSQLVDKFDPTSGYERTCCKGRNESHFSERVVEEGMTCCGGKVYGESEDGHMGCCGSVRFDRNDHMCCQDYQTGEGKLHPWSYDAGCCGLVSFNYSSHYCYYGESPPKVTPLNILYNRGVAYDKTKQTLCDDEEGTILDLPGQNLLYPINYKCCNKALIDADLFKCCPANAQRNIVEHPIRLDKICCGNSSVKSNSRREQCCNGVPNKISKAAAEENHRCCGPDLISEKYECCNGQKLEPVFACCGGKGSTPELYDEHNQLCCGSQLVDKFDPTSGYERTCCKGRNETHFSERVVVEGMTCCGGKVYSESEDGHMGCCGSVRFDRNDHMCCQDYQTGEGKLHPWSYDADCCGLVSFNYSSHYCYYGESPPKVTPLNILYNRGVAYDKTKQTLCDDEEGTILDLPGQNLLYPINYKCCNKALIDADLFKCCPANAQRNIVEHPIRLDKICCGNSSVKRYSRREQCCNGVPNKISKAAAEENHRCCGPDFISAKYECCNGQRLEPEFACCGGKGSTPELYDKHNQLCCGSQLVDKFDPTSGYERTCCKGRNETHFSERVVEERMTCCGGKVYSETEDGHMGCCGAVSFDRNDYICCHDYETGEVKLHPWSYDVACCGLAAFNYSSHYCYNGESPPKVTPLNILYNRGVAYDRTKQTPCYDEQGTILDLPGQNLLYPINYKCCNKALINADLFKCCPANPQRNIVEHPIRVDKICCGNSSVKSYSRREQCCNGVPNKISKAAAEENHRCCGPDFISAKYECCNGQRLEPEFACCGGKEAYSKMAPIGCCGGHLYNTNDQVCCSLSNSFMYPISKKEKDHTDCCISIQQSYSYNRFNQSEVEQCATVRPAMKSCPYCDTSLSSTFCKKKSVLNKYVIYMNVTEIEYRPKATVIRGLSSINRNLEARFPFHCGGCIEINKKYAIFTNRKPKHEKQLRLNDKDMIIRFDIETNLKDSKMICNFEEKISRIINKIVGKSPKSHEFHRKLFHQRRYRHWFS